MSDNVSGLHHNRSVSGAFDGSNRPLVRDDFRRLLAECDLSQAELARRIGVHQNTVSNWANGANIPGAVSAYLRLFAKVRALVQ